MVNSIYLYIFIFITIISKEIKRNLINNMSEIYLIIQGNGTQNFLSPNFTKEPSEVLVNGIIKENCFKTCDLNRDENIIILRFEEEIETCEYMFQELNNIREIDLSNFDASKVTNMHCMFYNCSNLEKINFGNINTSNVIDMQSLFNNCSNLISVNLSNFDTSNVVNTSYMFHECLNLKYLDLSNFDTKRVINIVKMFYNCQSLIYLNIKSFELSTQIQYNNVIDGISSYIKYCYELDPIKYILQADCSNTCFQDNIKIDINNNMCVESCINNGYQYEYNNICYNECPKGTLINNNKCEDNKCKFNYQNTVECMGTTPQGYYLDINDGRYKKCFKNCKFCYGPGNETINNCIECISDLRLLNDSIYDTNCYQKCNHYYYFNQLNEYKCTEKNFCPTDYNMIIKDKKKCVAKCEDDNIYKYEHNNKCYKECPSGSYSLFNDENNNCLTTIPAGYYLDLQDNKLKECYYTCKICEAGGYEQNHNCKECISNYIFYNNKNNLKNCYEKCGNYYYFDESNNFHCTENKSCPVNYNKLISTQNRCIDDCKNDDTYKYEYQNICYAECPNEICNSETTNILVNNAAIINETTNILLYNTSIIQETTIIKASTFNIYSLKDKYNNTEIYNIIKDVIIKDYSPQSDQSQIIEGVDNIVYHITTGNNELELLNSNSSDNYNLSIIDLGECENILREKYKISEEDFMIYLKQINLTDKESEKNVQLEVYEPYNKTKLNLSYCSGTNYDLYLKIELSPETKKIAEELEKLGYNMFDISDRFYNDICTPYKSENDTDILLSDRIDFIYNNSDAQCQDNCEFSDIILVLILLNAHAKLVRIIWKRLKRLNRMLNLNLKHYLKAFMMF